MIRITTGVMMLLMVVLSVGALQAEEHAKHMTTWLNEQGQTVEGDRCSTYQPSDAEVSAIAEQTRRWIEENGVVPTEMVSTIPVAFHVLRSNTGQYDVSDPVLQDQIDVLNAAFSNTNFQFSFASVDRTNNSTWTAGNDEFGFKSALAIDPATTLNFYTGNLGGGLLGWAVFPWSYPETSAWHGVVCLYSSLPGGSAVPYDEGDTGTHEIGHYLGLYHTFQGGCSASGDEVADTEPEQSPRFGCPLGAVSCSTPDPVENFMDYTDDDCMNHFTAGQSTRMDAMVAQYKPTLLNGGGNASPVAEANGPYAATTGDAINFSSAGSNDPDGSIASYFWDFDDGNTSTSANPSHTYASAGSYSVVLTVTDDMGAIDTDGATATVTDAGGGIPCSDVTSFVARCNNAGSLQMRARFVPGHNGETVTFTIDGSDVRVVSIANDRAQLALPNYGAGAHTVSLSDPAGCYADISATCTALQADGNALQSLETIPESVVLDGNYPNPFNPTTTIRYGLPSDEFVTLKIYNSLGQEVRTLVEEFRSAGYQEVQWDGTNQAGQQVTTGMYIYRLRAGNVVTSSQMMFSK